MQKSKIAKWVIPRLHTLKYQETSYMSPAATS